MVDIEYSAKSYRSPKTDTLTIMKNPEMLKLVYFITKNRQLCVNKQLKKLLFVIRYAPDQYKIQQMCGKTISENGEKLEFVRNCHIN